MLAAILILILAAAGPVAGAERAAGSSAGAARRLFPPRLREPRAPVPHLRPPAGGLFGPARTHYPVVYLLDGDSLFPMLAANHLFLTYDEQLPEAIVVGIAYGSFDPSINRRDIDFTLPGAAAFQVLPQDRAHPLGRAPLPGGSGAPNPVRPGAGRLLRPLFGLHRPRSVLGPDRKQPVLRSGPRPLLRAAARRRPHRPSADRRERLPRPPASRATARWHGPEPGSAARTRPGRCAWSPSRAAPIAPTAPAPIAPACSGFVRPAGPAQPALTSGRSFARSLRIVVAATPPSPMAWLIWSRPMTTSPAA